MCITDQLGQTFHRSKTASRYAQLVSNPVRLSGADVLKGFAHAALLATWAVGDQIFIGIMGGEAQNPRFSMGHATKLVPYRVIFVYMTCVVFITLLIPSNNDKLLGGSGVTASPFVLAIELANIPYVSSILNAGIMCGILAISAESIYLSSRILRTMSNQKLIPEWVAHVDRKGRPVRALILTCLTAVVLSYINLSGTCFETDLRSCFPCCVYDDTDPVL